MPELTPLTPAQVADLTARAGLGRARGSTLLAEGFANTSYLVDRSPGAPIVLTVVNDKSTSQALGIWRLQRVLAEDGRVPVPRPLAHVRLHPGEVDAAGSGRTPELVLFKEYEPGEIPERLGPCELRALGAMHAELHTLPLEAAPDLPQALDYGPDTWGETETWPAEHAEFVSWLTGWRRRVEDTGVDQLPRAIVHFDVDCSNTVWRGAHLAAVLDWEEACVTARVWDLASTLCWAHRGAAAWQPGLEAALLAGYGADALSAAERAAIRPLTGAAAAAHAFWHWRTNHFVRPGPDPERVARARMAIAEATLRTAPPRSASSQDTRN